MKRQNGRKALITGAGSGIGRAIATRLAAEGCDIGILDLDLDGAYQTAELVLQAGGAAHVERGDVTDQDDVRRAAEGLIAKLGHVDILVNNAGILRLAKLLDTSEQDWRDSFRVNVDGVFWSTKAVLPHMVERRSGCVVNMASWCGKKGVANYAAYCASKFAVVGLTQSLAAEMAEYGIRVNAVCPGLIVDTRMRAESDVMHREQGLPSAVERAKTIPLGRPGYPADVAKLVAFLASDDADYMTGQSVNVTGGLWTH